MSFNNRNKNIEPSKAIERDIEDSVGAWKDQLTEYDKKIPIVIREGSSSSSEASSHPSDLLDSEAQVSHDSDLHLTFGIEFEFVVRLEILGGEKETATPNDVIHYIKRDLIKRGVKASTKPSDTRYWNIDIDASIEANNTTCFGIEIASPAYFYDVHALAEVVQVCDILCDDYPSYVDDSCGLHVHIGYGTNGFRLAHLKNLFAFLYAFHDVLATVHPLRRRSGKGAKWCMSTRTASRLAESNTQNGSVTERPWAALQQIYMAQDVSELVRLTELPEVGVGLIYGKMAYKFSNVMNDGVSGKLTIEFRQHEGTIDAEASTRWIRSVAGLVEAIRRMSVDTFMDFLERHLNNPDLNVVQLLLALGLETGAVYYSRQQELNLSDFLPEDVKVDSPLDPAEGTVGRGKIMPPIA